MPESNAPSAAKQEALARAQLIAQQLASSKKASAGQFQQSFDSATAEAPVNPYENAGIFPNGSNAAPAKASKIEELDPFITKDLNVPGNMCGLIIGKNGDTIKKLQQETGVKIELIQDTAVASSAHKPLRFTGYQSKIDAAIEHIKAYLINHVDVKKMSSLLSQDSDLLTKHLKVPKIAVGAVIGKNGDMIKEIMNLSNAKVQFDKDELSDSTSEKTLIIVGSPTSVELAETKIIEIINNSVKASQDVAVPTVGKLVKTMFPIPFDRIGVVVGKSGAMIREINKQSGATAKLADKRPDESGNKYFSIEGGTENVKYCIGLLCERAGIPSPLEQLGMANPMMNAGNQQIANTFGQPQPQADQMQQPQYIENNEMKPQQTDPNTDPNVAAAYAMQQQLMMGTNNMASYALPNAFDAQSMQNNTQQMDVQLANGMANQNIGAIPPVKDYTLDWIAYYRAQGQNDEADKLQKQYDERMQQAQNVQTS